MSCRKKWIKGDCKLRPHDVVLLTKPIDVLTVGKVKDNVTADVRKLQSGNAQSCRTFLHESDNAARVSISAMKL